MKLAGITESSVIFITAPLAPPAKLSSLHQLMNVTREIVGDNAVVIFSSPLYSSNLRTQPHRLFLAFVEERVSSRMSEQTSIRNP
jgi:hypothetical protein